jgi:hypothetical protein
VLLGEGAANIFHHGVEAEVFVLVLAGHGHEHFRVSRQRRRDSAIAEQAVSDCFVHGTGIAHGIVEIELRHPGKLLSLYELVQIDFQRAFQDFM